MRVGEREVREAERVLCVLFWDAADSRKEKDSFRSISSVDGGVFCGVD